jgi:hypothetical protein
MPVDCSRGPRTAPARCGGVRARAGRKSRSWRKVSAQVYEPETNPEIAPLSDHERLALDDSESTPIFHALVQRSADPVEHFRRDPLRAPLPAPAMQSGPPATTRMLLQSVPSGPAEPSGGRHRCPATTRMDRPAGEPVGLDTLAAPPPLRSHSQAPSRAGGRHRAVPAVPFGSPGPVGGA